MTEAGRHCSRLSGGTYARVEGQGSQDKASLEIELEELGGSQEE